MVGLAQRGVPDPIHLSGLTCSEPNQTPPCKCMQVIVVQWLMEAPAQGGFLFQSIYLINCLCAICSTGLHSTAIVQFQAQFWQGVQSVQPAKLWNQCSRAIWQFQSQIRLGLVWFFCIKLLYVSKDGTNSVFITDLLDNDCHQYYNLNNFKTHYLSQSSCC